MTSGGRVFESSPDDRKIYFAMIKFVNTPNLLIRLILILNQP